VDLHHARRLLIFVDYILPVPVYPILLLEPSGLKVWYAVKTQPTQDEKLTLAFGTVINANAFDTTYPFALPHVSGSHRLGFLQANQTSIHSHVRRRSMSVPNYQGGHGR
jgi:hypothetical protein